jgi:hypothetical protein
MLSRQQLMKRMLYVGDKPDVFKVLCCITNYLAIILAYKRVQHEPGVVAGLLVTLLITIAMYHCTPTAAGVSTLWAFAYGYMACKSQLDDRIFLLACSAIAIPWIVDNNIRKSYDPSLWPWQQSYPFIATFAHLAAAVFGAMLGSLYKRKVHYILGMKIG